MSGRCYLACLVLLSCKQHDPYALQCGASDASAMTSSGGRVNRVLPPSEDAIRINLATEPIVDIERGTGGRSVGFRLTLQNGSRAYFKPEQKFSAAHWYGEIAAYHLDRLLGLNRAIPSVGRVLPWSLLKAHAYTKDREEVIVAEDGSVKGVMIAWIEEKLVPLKPGHQWERWLRKSGALPKDWNTPFQRPSGYTAGLSRISNTDSLISQEEPLKNPDTADRVSELSDLILFDYLIMNQDRWGGDFTNVRTRGEHGPLIYLDNAASFSPHILTNGLMLSRLHAVQKFRSTTAEAIQRLDINAFKTALRQDPLGTNDPILDEEAFTFLEIRRQHILEHIKKTVARFGQDVLLY